MDNIGDVFPAIPPLKLPRFARDRMHSGAMLKDLHSSIMSVSIPLLLLVLFYLVHFLS